MMRYLLFPLIFSSVLISAFEQIQQITPPGLDLPVIIKGEKVKNLLGLPLDQIIVLHKNQQGEIRSIPFQIDEFFWNNEDTCFLPIIPGDPKSPESDKVLGQNDEIVFMALDGGQPAEEFELAGSHVYEINIKTNSSDEKNYIYIAENRSQWDKSNESYMLQDKTKIHGQSYVIYFEPSFPEFAKQINVLSEKDHQMHAFVLGHVFLGFFDVKLFPNIHLTRENFQSRLLGTISGPVRVIRRIQNTVKLGPISIKSLLPSDLFYYRSYMELSGQVKISGAMAMFLRKNSTAQNIFYLNPNETQGARFFTGQIRPPFHRKEIQTPGEEVFPGKTNQWAALLADGWGFYFDLSFRSTSKGEPIQPELFFKDNRVPGLSKPEFGYSFNIKEFPIGNHAFRLRQYFGHLSEGDLSILSTAWDESDKKN